MFPCKWQELYHQQTLVSAHLPPHHSFDWWIWEKYLMLLSWTLIFITCGSQPVHGGQGVFPKCWPGQPSHCEKPCPIRCYMGYVDEPASIWGLELTSPPANPTMPMTSNLDVISDAFGTHPYSSVHNFFRAMKTRGFLLPGSFLREPNRWQHHGSRKQRDS